MRIEIINTETNNPICLRESSNNIIGLYSKSVKRKFKSRMKSKNKRFKSDASDVKETISDNSVISDSIRQLTALLEILQLLMPMMET